MSNLSINLKRRPSVNGHFFEIDNNVRMEAGSGNAREGSLRPLDFHALFF